MKLAPAIALLGLAACGGPATPVEHPPPTSEAPTELETAIARFEAFVRAHPDDPRHTPDALFRLADLYATRDREAYEADAALHPADGPDYSATVATCEDLLTRFPTYDHATEVRYLSGYSLAEMQHMDRAREVWLAAVCPGGAGPGDDPFGACPAPDGPLAAEMWYRLGDGWFEGDASELAQASAAYARAASVPAAPIHAFALFRLAWSLYRRDRYEDALARFAGFLEAAPESELRDDAIAYVALIVAHDDWDEDGTPDGPSALDRCASHLPTEAAWAPEAALRVGDVLFDEARFEDAVRVWRAARDRWPDAVGEEDMASRLPRAAAYGAR